MKIFIFPALAGLALLASAAPFAAAEPYPARPVQLVVGYPEGGSGDAAARLMAEKLPSLLGQAVEVVHRPGSSGAIAAESVARAAPDGYTLLIGQTPEMAISKSLGKDLGYDPERDFEPVALVFISPLALVVNAKSPYAHADDLLEAARASPKGFTYASAGPGTVGQFAGELFRLGLEGKLTHLPLEGAGAAMKAVADGRAAFYFAPLASAMPQVRHGKLKILPLPQAPATTGAIDDPGTARPNLQATDMSAWVGLFAPRGTPGEIVGLLNHAVTTILNQPETRRRLVRDGAFVTPMRAAQFADFVKAETVKYAAIIEESLCARPLAGGCSGEDIPSR